MVITFKFNFGDKVQNKIATYLRGVVTERMYLESAAGIDGVRYLLFDEHHANNGGTVIAWETELELQPGK